MRRARDGHEPPPKDPLHQASLALWDELLLLLPRYRRLHERRLDATELQREELDTLRLRIERLRAKSLRYRQVMREEADAAWTSSPLGALELMERMGRVA